MKITDVIELVEAAAYGAPGSRAMGSANFALLSRHYTKPDKRYGANLMLNFGNNDVIELTDADVDAIAKYYDSLPADSDRYDFVYDTMSRSDKFNALLVKLGVRKPTAPPIPTGAQGSLDLTEREVKKNDPDISRSGVRSAGLSTALRQAYAKYPQAQSDIEALIMHDMDVQKNTNQTLQAQTKINSRQDDIDDQLQTVARKQSNKISSLDQENDDLSAELDRLSRELDAMHGQVSPEPVAKKDKDSDQDTNKASEPSTVNVNVGSSDRAEKAQTRAAGAKQRQAEPARLKPGSVKPTKLKPVGATVPTAVTAQPQPTIDVIDEPATDLEKPSASEPKQKPALALPTKLSQTYQDPDLDPDFDADAAYDSARNSEEMPDNVFRLPTRAPAGSAEPDQPDLFGNPRTGTYNESQELRRMRELAGLTQ